VLAADIPAVREIVDDGVNGRLLPPDDEKAWAVGLIQLLGDPSRAVEMGEAGAHRIEERCHPDIVAAQTLEAYELAIAERRRRH
jgi:glycosyltransferase involved in cell wall biosynthesis